MTRRLLLTLCVLLTGCGSHHWSKAGVTEQEFHADSYDCAKTSSSDGASFTRFGGYQQGTTVSKDLYRSCMRARGYVRDGNGTMIGVKD
jgi:hypothetical protein